MSTRWSRGAALALGTLFAPVALASMDDVFPSAEEAASVNTRTVGVVFSESDLFLDLVNDLEDGLELAAGLRIVPVLGKNDVQSVYDLLYLKGIDLALVRADAIEYVRRVGGMGSAQRLTHNVVRIGDEKIAIIAGEDYSFVDELGGQPVGFGQPGSGEFVTGTLLFEALDIEPEVVESDAETALERVRSGELAAVIRLLDAPDALSGAEAAPAAASPDTDAAPEPSPELPDDGATAEASSEAVGRNGLRVLAVPRREELTSIYRFTTLDEVDLPDLIGEGQAVSTYSVDVNLVAYAWNETNERTERLETFVEALVDRLEDLQGDAYQPTWKAVSLSIETPNLYSSPMVAQVLAEREATKARLLEEKARAEAEAAAAAEAERIATLAARREDVIARLDEELDAEDSTKLESLLDELDAVLAKARESVDAEGTSSGAGAASDE